jgi:general secretion pathway protein C
MQARIEQIITGLTDRASGFMAGFSVSAGMIQIALALVVITVASYLTVGILYKIAGLQMTARGNTVKEHAAFFAPQAYQREPLASYNVIAERNIFHTTMDAIADKEAEIMLPTEEYTAFDLKGTIAVDENIGYAIVEERGKGSQKLYRIGEMIGSARLIRVTRKAAILNSDGRDLVMKIKEPEAGSSSGRLSSRADLHQNAIAVSREEVTQTMGDLKTIMSQAIVRPYLTDGAQHGFIISNIVPGSLYERLGLKNGDVVTSVNGRELTGVDDAMQLVNTMQSGGDISVSLLRNGANETLNYSFR